MRRSPYAPASGRVMRRSVATLLDGHAGGGLLPNSRTYNLSKYTLNRGFLLCRFGEFSKKSADRVPSGKELGIKTLAGLWPTSSPGRSLCLASHDRSDFFRSRTAHRSGEMNRAGDGRAGPSLPAGTESICIKPDQQLGVIPAHLEVCLTGSLRAQAKGKRNLFDASECARAPESPTAI